MPGVPDPAVPGEWADRAACKGYPVAWWFPAYEHFAGKPQRETKEDAAVALRICAELCMVRAECLIHALRHREVGLWGGTTDRERKAIRDRLKRRAA